MNINDFIKALDSLRTNINESQPTNTTVNGIDMSCGLIGKYVIVRSSNEGVNAGVLVSANQHGVRLKEARRMWKHQPKTGAWYESVALTGLSDKSMVSAPVDKVIVESYSLTQVSDVAEQSIRDAPNYVPSP